MQQQQRDIIITRRNVVFATIAIPLTLRSGAARANMREDRDRDDARFTYQPRFTTKEFLKMKPADLRFLKKYWNAGKITVDGFSVPGTMNLFQMALINRAWTRKLLRDMAKLKGRAKRRARLQAEAKRVSDLIANIKASINRLQGKTGPGAKLAIKQEKAQLQKAEDFLFGVKFWLGDPEEGAK